MNDLTHKTDSREPGHNISSVLIQLLKGVVYKDRHPKIWQDLLVRQGPVMDYFSVIGLDVLLDEAEGFAFLRQAEEKSQDDDPSILLPRLITRRPMSYPLSLLSVLLRKKLAEFDAEGGSTRLILSRKQIVDMMRVFMPSQKNEARTVDVIDTMIKKTMDLGFLKKMGSEDHLYEVCRIIKALVDADWLKNLDNLMKEYMAYANKKS
jgi:Domain of unknown function (DUF4194)